jgi:uncharacterized protein with WD repeat
MYNVLSTIDEAIHQKKEFLKTAKEKREAHIRSLCSQQKAIDSLEYNISELERERMQLWDIQAERNQKEGNQGLCATSTTSNKSISGGIKSCNND